jgi:PBP1b-binding outer membrane lipoprotein LpoB
MLKKTLLILGILALFLAGCASQTGTPDAASKETSVPSSTQAQNPSSGTQSEAVAAKCTVTSSLLPAANEIDWALGSTDARYTIIEYGDFQ